MPLWIIVIVGLVIAAVALLAIYKPSLLGDIIEAIVDSF